MRLIVGLFVAAMLAGSAGAEAAAAVKSCPPLGVLPGFEPQPARILNYQTVEFYQKIAGTEDLESVSVSGRSCKIGYELQAGKDSMSDLEIYMNYRHQMETLGAEIMSDGVRGVSARLIKNGVETWLNAEAGPDSVTLTVVQKQPPRVTLLPPTAADYRLLGRMPTYVGEKPVVRNFDQKEFTVQEGDEQRTVKVQGRTIDVGYGAPTEDAVATNEEIQFNYRDALAKLGAEILYTAEFSTTARLVSNGQVVWISVEAQYPSISVHVVEEKPFEPSIKPATDTLRTALDKAGRVALYVNFDFGKATLRPEAAPVVAQVVGLLRADPALKLSIEGHTDNLGTAELNQTLSQDRAAALVAALAAQGIAANRLTSAGYGASKPVATNDTSDGRARNRRVELVKM